MPSVTGVGGRCRPKPAGFVQRRPTPSGDLVDQSRVPPLTIGDSSEQAYVPAEQPPPPQGARLPAAHAHPCRALDPVCAPPQGPQEPGRLSPRGSTRPCLLRPCSRHRIASPAVATCGASRAEAADVAAPPWSCTCCGARPMSWTPRPASGSRSVEPWATPWCATVSNADSAISSVTVLPISPRAARWSSAPCHPRRWRRTRNSVQTSTVVSNGPSVTHRCAGRGV